MTVTSRKHSRSDIAAPEKGTPIGSVGDIPIKMDEAQAAEFYGTHGLTEEALEEMADVSDQFGGTFIRTRPISIRFPESMLADLKAVAAQKGVAYQALIKIWLDERLQQERERVKRSA